MIALALWLKERDMRPRQVQDFIPTPMSMATAMYYTGLDPFTASRSTPPRTCARRSCRRRSSCAARVLGWRPA
jgi:radical SAM superfamily enzyme YgiQ (UPF0313 family)